MYQITETSPLSFGALMECAKLAVSSWLYSVTDSMQGQDEWDLALVDLEIVEDGARAKLHARKKDVPGWEPGAIRRVIVSCSISESGKLSTPVLEMPNGRQPMSGSAHANGWLTMDWPTEATV